ncbi:mechanosensitive ion channel family protein [Mesohalobacter halotolerans]|uniref:Mechanosensitive ion channel family protein n=1 Tax=Mesohalobacter halotolerans TaxID=1883405 RepID=A0A4U5TRG4_9FLAO|nr:mechanosensitive ion channel family protein [Mesohalobacter halotolerans]MBS3738672.1 mechanosensitive ion channel family protein [Psychroflexus sp.]TKS56572.1 mechanosensitive ion channel family protein [Mesohalobacter halotolerans]
MVYQDKATKDTTDQIFDNTHTAWSELQDKLDNWVDSLILNLPNFILAVLVFILFILIANLSAIGINKILRKTKAQHSVRVVAIRIYKAIVILIGFFIALGILDLSTVLTSVLGAAGVLGLAVGLALQGTLTNTFSGVVLSFIPKIQIGDWVETNGFEGFVIDINLRSVTLKTADQNLVSIPNSKIVDNPFKNLSSDDRSIAILECGVGYESDLEFVEKITKQAIEEALPQEKTEKVEFFYKEFGNSSINYEVRFGIKETNAKDELLAKHIAVKAIKKAYNENNINIPFPIRTLDFGKNKFRSETLEIKNRSTS